MKNTIFNTVKTKVNNLGKIIPDATTLIHINTTHKQNMERKNWVVDKKYRITVV